MALGGDEASDTQEKPSCSGGLTGNDHNEDRDVSSLPPV